MIHISCPNNNIPERTYAIQVLLTEVLGCDSNGYSIQFRDDVAHYELNNEGCKLVIEDHFFNNHTKPLSYLKTDNLPVELLFFHGLGMELPIIYGVDKFIREKNIIIVGLDIFASTFFMLTRWEESLLGREEKGDCDESLLFTVKHGIHIRPIVNEYALFLHQLLPSVFPSSSRNYEVALTHDVDGFVTPSWMRIAKDIMKQTIFGPPKNKVLNLTWKEKIKYRFAFPSAYSQFEMYTGLAEKHHIPEWFYFKACDKGEIEATYFYDDRKTHDVVNKLKSKNNLSILLGFHPSQNVFGKKEQWNKEVSRITELLQVSQMIGRNHHLLFNHSTLRCWESLSDNPLHISNCVFHKRQGFRSGICVPYSLFDLYQRRVMNLVEHPCQIMDTVIRYDKKTKSEQERWQDVKAVIDVVKQYNGELVLTWHIYIRNKKLIQDYFQWCEKVVCYAVHES